MISDKDNERLSALIFNSCDEKLNTSSMHLNDNHDDIIRLFVQDETCPRNKKSVFIASDITYNTDKKHIEYIYIKSIASIQSLTVMPDNKLNIIMNKMTNSFDFYDDRKTKIFSVDRSC